MAQNLHQTLLMALTGKGIFVWKVSAIYGGNVAQIAQEAKDAGLSHVIVKIADGRYRYNVVNGRDLGAELISQLKARGIQAWGWQYVYGSNPTAEADLAIQLTNQLGLAGFVVNAEGQFKAKGMQNAAEEYMSRLRKKLPRLPIGLSTYRYPTSHTDFPFDTFLKHCDIVMPQVYWQGSSNPAEQLHKTLGQFKSLKHVRPILPTGSAYEFNGWSATPAQINEFLGEARAQGLQGANFWEWGAALLKGGALWKAVQDYDWDDPSDPVVVPPNQPTYLRLKHDNQWMTDPKTGKRVRSRMELSDWNPGYHFDAYPAVVPLWTGPKSGDGAYKYSKSWAQFLRASNPVNYAELERVAAGLFNPRVNNQPSFPSDLTQYDGNTVAQGIGSTGNLYQVLEEKSGSVRVKLLDFQSVPPAPVALNYEDTPWLVNAFTAVTKDGSLKKTVGKDVAFPNLGHPTAGWVPKERVEFFPALPAYLTVVNPVNFRKGPGLTYDVIGGYARGDSCVVTEYQPRGSNVWGKIGQDRWIALVYTNQAGSTYYTNWKMETNPPLALVNPRPYLEKPTTEQPAPTSEPVLTDLIERYFAALNKGDASKVMELYDKKNGKLVAEDRQFVGQKAIYNWYLRVFKNKLPGGRFKLTKVEKDGSFYDVSWTATARKAAVADGRDLIRIQDSGPELINYHYTQFRIVKT